MSPPRRRGSRILGSFVWIPAFAGMTVLSMADPWASTASGQEKSKGTLPDVLIQAEENRPVTREKPPFNPEVKEDVPLEGNLQADAEVRSKLPSEIKQMTLFIPGVSNSPHVAVPSTNWIVEAWKGEPARVFYPMQELSRVYQPPDTRGEREKGSWELSVIDASGKVFKKFGGAGLPPERQEFDGRNEVNSWLKVGQVYTGLLTYTDSAKRSHTAMGKPFALAGLSLQGKEGPLISLAPRALFEPKSSGAPVSDSGRQLLREAAQLIERHYPGLSLEVAVHLSRSDRSWVQSAADACAKELTDRLRLGSSAVTSKGYPGTPDLEERVDVLILNR